MSLQCWHTRGWAMSDTGIYFFLHCSLVVLIFIVITLTHVALNV